MDAFEEEFKIIAIGCDHAGFDLKNIIIKYLEQHNFIYKDYGTYDKNSCDYPDYAKLVCESIINNKSKFGVLICNTGIGISICANKFSGIRAALCNNSFGARMSREHNDANVLALGAGVIGKDLALDILKTFLQTNFSDELRHVKRIDEIKKLENKKSE